MKKTTVLALAGGATAVAGLVTGAVAAVRETSRSNMGSWDCTVVSLTDALRDANATTDDEIVECVLAHLRKRTENIGVQPVYQPVLKFGPATTLWRTRRPSSNAETATLHLLRNVFETLDGGNYTLSDRAVRQIVMGALALVKEYEDAQEERITAYFEMLEARFERFEPAADLLTSAVNRLYDLKGQAGELTEKASRRLRRS